MDLYKDTLRSKRSFQSVYWNEEDLMKSCQIESSVYDVVTSMFSINYNIRVTVCTRA